MVQTDDDAYRLSTNDDHWNTFLGMSEKYQRKHVAQMLGLNPDKEDDWPLDTIDNLLERARTAFRRQLEQDIYNLGAPR